MNTKEQLAEYRSSSSTQINRVITTIMTMVTGFCFYWPHSMEPTSSHDSLIASSWGLPASFRCLKTALFSRDLSHWRASDWCSTCEWRYINLQIQYSTLLTLLPLL